VSVRDEIHKKNPFYAHQPNQIVTFLKVNHPKLHKPEMKENISKELDKK